VDASKTLRKEAISQYLQTPDGNGLSEAAIIYQVKFAAAQGLTHRALA
jgi:hypothetical protein